MTENYNVCNILLTSDLFLTESAEQMVLTPSMVMGIAPLSKPEISK